MITLPIHSLDDNARDLQQRVALQLQNSQLAFGGRVKVEVRHSVVTLSGNVPTFYQRQLIYAATRRVAGVTKVIDQLEVDGQSAADSRGGRIIA